MTTTINERQKKFLLVVPLLAIPFLTMLFWALGGGKDAQAANAKKQVAGLNMQLPGAKLKNDSSENKLSLYAQAEMDSLKFKKAQSDDPYYHADSTKNPAKKDSLKHDDSSIVPRGNALGTYQPFTGQGLSKTASNLSANELEVNQKLAALKYQISQPPAPQNTIQNGVPGNNVSDSELKQMQSALKNAGSANESDPQMEQMSQMLEKIKEIQNPGLVRQKMKDESEKNKGMVFAVSGGKKDDPVSTLDNGTSSTAMNSSSQQNGFYSLNEPETKPDSQNSIEAVIATTQTLVNGSTVKLRLTNDVYINGTLIPQNTFVSGMADLSGERLGIKISSIRYKKSLFPVSLSVFDLDGIDGVYIPGAITRDVAKESADQSVQNLGITSYDPSLGAQAVNAGITAGKTLFSRHIRLVKVTVKAGYQVLLKDEKQKQLNK